jgi:hypothetical protein
MKQIVIAALLLCGINLSFGQITEKEDILKTIRIDSLDGWKNGGFVALNISQVGLTNWAAGGQSSVALNGIVSLFANLKKGRSTWDSTLDLVYENR